MSVTLSLSVRNERALTRVEGAHREADRRVNRTMRLLDKKLIPAIRPFAPRDTGRLRRELRSAISFRGDAVNIAIHSGATRDGYPYTDVTRFGHRKRYIFPKRKKGLKVYPLGRRNGAFMIVGVVRGYRPSRDWLDEAMPGVHALVARSEEQMSREVVFAYGRR